MTRANASKRASHSTNVTVTRSGFEGVVFCMDKGSRRGYHRMSHPVPPKSGKGTKRTTRSSWWPEVMAACSACNEVQTLRTWHPSQPTIESCKYAVYVNSTTVLEAQSPTHSGARLSSAHKQAHLRDRESEGYVGQVDRTTPHCTGAAVTAGRRSPAQHPTETCFAHLHARRSPNPLLQSPNVRAQITAARPCWSLAPIKCCCHLFGLAFIRMSHLLRFQASLKEVDLCTQTGMVNTCSTSST